MIADAIRRRFIARRLKADYPVFTLEPVGQYTKRVHIVCGREQRVTIGYLFHYESNGRQRHCWRAADGFSLIGRLRECRDLPAIVKRLERRTGLRCATRLDSWPKYRTPAVETVRTAEQP